MVNNKTTFLFTCGCKFAVVLHAGLQGSRLMACKAHSGKIVKGDVDDLNAILPLQLRKVKDDAFQIQSANALHVQSASPNRKEVAIGAPTNRSGITGAPQAAKGKLESSVKPISDKEAEALFNAGV